jgi:hypothetical protein
MPDLLARAHWGLIFAGSLTGLLASCSPAASDGGALRNRAGNGGAAGSAGSSAHGGNGVSGNTSGGNGGALAGGGGQVPTGGGGGAGNASSAGTGGVGTAGSGANGGGTTGAANCSSLPLCDDFEATAALAPPNPALWTLVPSSAMGAATVDEIGAHGSAHSLKVVSPDRVYMRNSTVIGTLGPVVHVRFYARFATALADGHGALIVTHPMPVDQYSQGNELRFGSQGDVFHWNTDSDAANLPDVSPNGNAASFKPTPNQWYCIELTINTNGHLNASIDGTDIPGLAEDGTPTPDIDESWVNSPQSLDRYKMLADFNFGWESYGGGPLTVWYDDVALSSSLIGCQ